MARHSRNRPAGLKNLHNTAAAAAQNAPSPPSYPLQSFFALHAPWITLLALALLAYAPALRAGFIWDDDALTRNTLLQSWSGLWKIWTRPSLIPNEIHYWPLVYTSFWLEHHLWGLAPIGYHLDNILLHALCAILLWRVLLRLDAPGAWLAAALFVAHPVHVESVAWIIERKDVLSGAFYLGAALAYLSYDQTSNKKFFALAAALFIAALLSKSVALTLPFALALALWWRRGRLSLRAIVPLAALAILAAVLVGTDFLFYQSVKDDVLGLNPIERLQLAGRALWFYPLKLAWPHPLVTLYPTWPVRAGSLAPWLPLLAAIALAAALWLARRRIGRAPLAAAAFTALTLAPTLGLIPFGFMRYSWVADRFQYLASIAPLALIAAAIANSSIRNPQSALRNRKFRIPHSAFKYSAFFLLLLLAALTFRQAGFYHDTITLFRHNTQVYPNYWAPYYELGGAYSVSGRDAETIASMREAQRLNPAGFYKINNELGRLLARQGKPDEAEAQFREALRLNPNAPEAHINFGWYLAERGRLPEAADQDRQALDLSPHASDALYNLGNVLVRQGRLNEAIQRLGAAVSLRPERPDYRTNLAMALARNNQPAEAIAQLKEALRWAPDSEIIHANLGGLLLSQGDLDGAIAHLEQATRMQSKNPNLHFDLGEAYRRKGRLPEAAAQYGEALQLKPDFTEAAQKKAACQPQKP